MIAVVEGLHGVGVGATHQFGVGVGGVGRLAHLDAVAVDGIARGGAASTGGPRKCGSRLALGLGRECYRTGPCCSLVGREADADVVVVGQFGYRLELQGGGVGLVQRHVARIKVECDGLLLASLECASQG